jgi:hypothetical protein
VLVIDLSGHKGLLSGTSPVMNASFLAGSKEAHVVSDVVFCFFLSVERK